MHISQLIKEQKKPFISLEFFPPKEPEQWPAFYMVAEKLKAINPLFVSVTYGAGGSTQLNTLELASQLKNRFQFETMVHFTCVGATAEKIDEFINQMQDAGIENVLALRGDKPKNTDFDWKDGEYKYAKDLVGHIQKKFPNVCLSVAGYPAPHPEAPTFREDREFLIQKINAGAEFIMTQLFFDTREYISLVEAVHDAGLDCPVIPGILPVLNLASIRHTLALCGANFPTKFYLDIEKAHYDGGADAVREVGLKYAINQIKDLLDVGAPGVHLYTLNKADLCIKIKDALADYF